MLKDRDRYTTEQIAVVLMQAALELDYYMQEEFDLYDVRNHLRKPVTPEWLSHGERLHEWCQIRIHEEGLGVWEQETFGDQLLLDDFHPIIQPVASSPAPSGGKLAFVALVLAFVLKAFSRFASRQGRELADEFRAQIHAYLREAWNVDLDREIVNPQLATLHLPQAHAAAEAWERRLELLSSPPLRPPFTEIQIASLDAYQERNRRDPWFICFTNGCRGVLRAAQDGLACSKCGQKRHRAWSWMADWSWQRR